MSIFSLLSFLAFIIYLYLGIYALKLDPRSRLNQMFFLLSLIFVIWAFTYIFFYSAPDKNAAWFWYKLSDVAKILYPAVLLHVSLIFTKKNDILKKWFSYPLIYLPALIFVYETFTSSFITQDLVLVNLEWYEVFSLYTNWWYAYTAYYSSFIILSIVFIGIWGYRSKIMRERKQASLIASTAFISLILGYITNSLYPVFSIYIFPNIDHIIVLIPFLGIWYAIVKYKLMVLTPAIAADEIISKITDLMILLNPEGKIIKINERVEKLLGYKESELVGMNWKYIVRDPQEQRIVEDGLVRTIKDALKQNKTPGIPINLEIGYNTRDGEKIPVNTFCSIIKDHENDIVGIVTVGQDMRQTKKLQKEIKERMKAQKDVRNHAQKLEILNQIIMSVNKSTDLKNLLSEVLNSTLKLMNFQAGVIHLVNKDKKQAKLLYSKGITDDIIDKIVEMNIREKSNGKIDDERSYFITNRFDEISPEDSEKWGITSLVRIPLLSKDEIVGYLTVSSKIRRSVLHLEKEILESISRETGAAITRILVEEKIKASLHEKEVLLREIYHRVKNNLQIVSSLLNLQSRYIKDEEVLEVFMEGQNRVKSMAMIHEKLYQSRDLARIDFADYVHGLTADLFHSYSKDTRQIKLRMKVDEGSLNIDTAIPCGLIINELVTNSLKYAFPPGMDGEIFIELHSHHNKYTLTVGDDGVGIPNDIDFKNTDSLGLQLVNILVEQLNGEIELDRRHGTEFKIRFEALEYKKRI